MKKEHSKTWKERVTEKLKNYGYNVEEFRDDGVLCKTRYGKYILIGYAEEEKEEVNNG